jgi:outer membrane lipoprotein-sorting protein
MSTQGTRNLAVLFFAIGLCAHGAHAQDLSASDLLRKIAERYRQVSSFSAVAEKKVDLDTDRMGERYIRLDPNEGEAGSHESDEIQLTLMASNSSKAKLLLKHDKREVVVVSDGKVVWTFIPAQHAYTEVTAIAATKAPVYFLQIASNEISGVYLLQQYVPLVAARFRSISSYEAGAKLEHSETLKVARIERNVTS